GEQAARSGVNTVWYRVSWSGRLTRWLGPPDDGQPHWAVEGASGTVYWVETTPDRDNPRQVQVLMSPLSDPDHPARTPASSLDGPVSSFTVSGRHLVWVQSQGGVRQLVVAEAN
ncbi:MAG: hypothetical protein K6T83_07295, partial [Alicyclobacillus sp.]|nr:hypothetical protein [Alicyclobacillus sp.]